MITVNYRDPRPLYEQIKESIIKLILTHALCEDEQLPSVRELAVELAINPNTIQRAYRELENEGYVYKVPGRGSFISPQTAVSADTAELLNSFREAAAKLIFSGESAETLRREIDSIETEVMQHD